VEGWLEEQLPNLLAAAHQPLAWLQVMLTGLAVALAWFGHRRFGAWLDRAIGENRRTRLQFAALDASRRLVFPLLLAFVLSIAYAAFVGLSAPHAILHIAVPLALSLALVRLLVYLLERALKPGPLLRASENVIGTLIWIGVAMYLLGWLPILTTGLDRVALTFGDNRISLLSIGKVLAAVLLVVVVSLWLARLVERWVMGSRHLSAGMRVGVTKFVRVMFLVVGVMVALQAVGINLSALTVFGGAVGVGLGFGLQRIASNFISGFILVSDRSIQPGDVITVQVQGGEERFGWVQELRARYIVVRDRDGVATLIPNENLIVNPVVNWSYGSKAIRIKIPVSISYSHDPERALELMVEAAQTSDRVLKTPEPVARLMAFGDSGVELELRVWIEDPEEGINNIRSDLNLAIWRVFRENRITIPFPQRDVHVKNLPPGLGG